MINIHFWILDSSYWNNLATNELEEALKLKWNTERAKNVILFVGDGMGPNTVTATRIYKHGESGQLSFEKFPHVGLLKVCLKYKLFGLKKLMHDNIFHLIFEDILQ